MMPQGPFTPNGKKVALIGAGPAALTVARDLAPEGYEIHLYDEQKLGGGFMRSQIPAFRLPETVLNEEVNYILDLGIHTHFNHYVKSLKSCFQKTTMRYLLELVLRAEKIYSFPDVMKQPLTYISE